MHKTIEERFWEKVDKEGSESYPDCWLWIASTDQGGYGSFYVDLLRRGERAHRYSWSLHNKHSIPIGILVCHTCDNPSCVNPDHLWLGTHSDNVQDCLKKGRNGQTNKTYCPRGHPYDEANTYQLKNKKGRACRTCGKEYKARNYTPALFKSRCPRGHLFLGSNLYVTPDGRRQCCACRRARTDKFHAKKRAKNAI